MPRKTDPAGRDKVPPWLMRMAMTDPGLPLKIPDEVRWHKIQIDENLQCLRHVVLHCQFCSCDDDVFIRQPPSMPVRPADATKVGIKATSIAGKRETLYLGQCRDCLTVFWDVAR